MRLQKLILNNFKGIKYLEIEPEGKSISIYGDNATGKTTIADAQCWLLFDKDSKGTANFSPKTKGIDGEDIHNLEHSVEGTYILADGSLITFCKVFKEDWKTKRGSSTETFSGHTTDYFVDGVPCKEKEYKDRLISISPIQDMMMLSLPLYFAESMSMSDRRSKLLEMTGDIGDYEIIASNDNISELAEYLRKPKTISQLYSVAEYEKIARATLKEINQDLKSIPGRIDEASRAMPEITVSEKEIEEEFSKLQCDKSILEIKLNTTNNEQVAEIKTQISELKTQLANAETQHIKNNQNIYADIDKTLSILNTDLYQAKNSLSSVKALHEENSRRMNNLEALRSETLQKYADIEKTVWNDDTVCATCGQPLPEDEIIKSKEKFNLNRSNKLLELNEFGKKNCSKEMITECQKAFSEYHIQVVTLDQKVQEIQLEISELNRRRSEITAPLFSSTKEYKEINSRIDEITYELVKVQKGLCSDEDETRRKLSVIKNRIDILNRYRADIELVKKQQKRIKELEKQEKQLGIESEKVQKGIYLCEEFVRTKVSMLDEKINSLFKTVKFRLFITQINGGIKEDCEVLIPSESGLVPFSLANNAARINAGLEIISALSEQYNFKMPVFVDNAESVTSLSDTDLQIIRLVVSADDKTLRVEQ